LVSLVRGLYPDGEVVLTPWIGVVILVFALEGGEERCVVLFDPSAAKPNAAAGFTEVETVEEKGVSLHSLSLPPRWQVWEEFSDHMPRSMCGVAILLGLHGKHHRR